MEERAKATPEATEIGVVTDVGPGPHVVSTKLTTRKMMLDILIGLIPIFIVAGVVFQLYALKQIAICVASCVAAEAIFTAMRSRRPSLGDLSAVVTGTILALSLPPTAPWYVGVIGGFAGVGLGKFVFGGLGQNIFNPAMVGRAFVMIAFANLMGATGYVDAGSGIDVVTQATPMSETSEIASLWSLLMGETNGSLGETSALACLLGGLYLCVRRTASWEIPVGMLGAVAILAGIQNLTNLQTDWTVLHHLLGGALLFGALFIATDPVTSPLTPRGKLIFGSGVGALVMLIRVFSSYPEGVMFAVLIMNALVPLINRWTVPRPVGGPVPLPAAN